MIFSKKDITQIENKGLTELQVKAQMSLFKKGVPFANLLEAATVGHGILKLTPENTQKSIALFEAKKNTLKLKKFVPASGAATRMFKFLFKFLKDYNPTKETINAYINRHKETNMSLFRVGIEKLPFYDFVLKELKKTTPNYKDLNIDERCLLFINTMLSKDSLNYSAFPKGLFPFHKYKDHIATAFEEHLFESALYIATNGHADLHFTISEHHNHSFDEEFKRIEEIVERKTKTKFNITFSYQKGSTDTIALTPKNEPFRNPDGSLLFRPSCHGALIENLNDLDANILFIKNIDNVVVYKFEKEVSDYKKMLAGILLEIRDQAFKYAKILDENATLQENKVIEIAEFLSNKLNVVISEEFEKYALKYQVEYLKEKLDRPIRVCGMVKNEGEPGGGPFWVRNHRGTKSLQIVESAQVDKKNKHQKAILKNATHFNPVDLVCSVKNYKGEKYNLKEYVDAQASFITMKTKTGKDLKALELPGLWNGAMAYWNTIFVEVPLITFNPVKTVNDLLKGPHQTS
jgi:hypothetical protein